MSTFEDTKWDILPRGKAKTAALDRKCLDLAEQVKKPTHFPIIPLASTLARARAEHSGMYVDNSRRKPMGVPKPPQLRRTSGRTRAASRRLTSANTTDLENLGEVFELPPEDASRSGSQGRQTRRRRSPGLKERNQEYCRQSL